MGMAGCPHGLGYPNECDECAINERHPMSATPITDEYIARHPVPGPHGSRLWCCDDCAFKYEENLRERIRADAAKIKQLEKIARAARASLCSRPCECECCEECELRRVLAAVDDDEVL